MIGRKISQYRVIRSLGQGGMGEVYLAEDHRLGRKVALKALPPEVADDPTRKKRFQRESRILAKLNHPGIVTIHDFVEEGDSSFLVMEYIEGSSLAERIGFEGLPLDDAIRILASVADAVAAAHREGIVHRDLKPENVMIREDGLVKVVDFGLSKLQPETVVGGLPRKITESLTREGAVMGTVHYMAPEVLEGRRAGPSADVFSMGVIFYEMLAAEKPFVGESALSVVTSILRDRPTPVGDRRQPLPSGLEEIVDRCLQKKPTQRFADAGELSRALSDLADETAVYELPVATRGRPPARRWVLGGLLAVTLGLAGLGIWHQIRQPSEVAENLAERSTVDTADRAERSPEGVASRETPVAVLPVRTSGAGEDLDSLAVGLTEALVSRLSRISRLHVTATSSARAAAREESSDREVSRALGVRYLVQGHLARRGEELNLTLSVVDPDSGATEWGETFQGPPGRLLDFLTEAAPKIGLAVGAEVQAGDLRAGASAAQSSGLAYEEYLRGLQELTAREPAAVQRALAHFSRATRESPDFAPAWAGRANASTLLASFSGGVVPAADLLEQARSSARRAVELRPDLADGHAALAAVKLNSWEAEGTEDAFRRAITLNPSHVQARVSYSALLVAQGRFQEALVQARNLLDLDPLNPISHQVLASIHYFAGDYPRAIEKARAGLERVGDFWLLRLTLGDALSLSGRFEEAHGELKKARDLSRDAAPVLTAIALNEIRRGNDHEAEEILGELRRRREAGYVPPSLIAKILFHLGHREEGFRWLERGLHEHDPLLTYLAVDPDYREIQSDPRFQELVERIGILA